MQWLFRFKLLINFLLSDTHFIKLRGLIEVDLVAQIEVDHCYKESKFENSGKDIGKGKNLLKEICIKPSTMSSLAN